jgi:hypothetical protein
MVGRSDDAATVARWSVHPPEVVVWLPTHVGDAREFGARGLGVDYGLATARFVETRYVPIVTPTAARPFFVLQLRR